MLVISPPPLTAEQHRGDYGISADPSGVLKPSEVLNTLHSTGHTSEGVIISQKGAQHRACEKNETILAHTDIS